MREIRFAAKYEGQIVPITHIDFEKGVWRDADRNRGGSIKDLVQYIGFKDKHGDIVEDVLGSKDRWLICWREELAAFEFIEVKSLVLATVNTWMPNADTVGYSFELIGNSIENPDLIERKG